MIVFSYENMENLRTLEELYLFTINMNFIHAQIKSVLSSKQHQSKKNPEAIHSEHYFVETL